MSKPYRTKYLDQRVGVRCGQICIRGTRLALSDILRESIHGVGEDFVSRVKAAWPYLKKKQIEAAMNKIFLLISEDVRP